MTHPTAVTARLLAPTAIRDVTESRVTRSGPACPVDEDRPKGSETRVRVPAHECFGTLLRKPVT